jgi:type IV pilus assembly protein PilA
MNTRTQQGFTLIELMIVVAIIGILAAIAIPAYNDYLIRAKVTEATAAASACKTSVAEYYQANNVFPTTLATSGCANTVTKYVSGISVGAGGAINVALDATNVAPATGSYILTPTAIANGAITWSCTGSTVQSKYLPGNCR